MTDNLHLHADIHDAAGNKLGAGPIGSIDSVNIKRRLDGSGSFEMSLPLTDDRVVSLIQNERRVRIYFYDGSSERELGRGVIRKKDVDVAESELSLFISGPDDLVELTFPSIGRGLIYDDEALSDIVDDLVSYASGWSATVDAGLGNYSTRIDGGNPLSALIKLAEQNGLHIRPALTSKTLEFGAFGTSLDLRVDGPVSNPQGVETNDNLLLVDRIKVVSDSYDIVNYIVPYGGGEGDSAITLEHSTRSIANGDPYDIQTTTKNGVTIWYVKDATSITAYGQIEQDPMVYKNITPISNNATALENAANALYDAAVADLQRMKDPLDTYRLTIKKPKQTIRPGDKLPVRYKGIAEREGSNDLTYVDIDDVFWIMTVDERIGNDTNTLTLDVASVDRHMQDELDVIVGAIEEQKIRSVAVQPYFNKSSYTVIRQISSEDGGFSADIPIFISDATLSLHRVLLRVKSRPFRATAKAASSGGAHRHQMFDNGALVSPSSPNDVAYTALDADAPGGNTTAVFFRISGTSVDNELWTYGSSDAHTHNLDYGINDDTQYPGGVTIAIDAVDRTSALGGSWGTPSTPINETLDITEYITGTLQQEQTVTLACGSGRGEVEVVVELYEVIQTLAVT